MNVWNNIFKNYWSYFAGNWRLCTVPREHPTPRGVDRRPAGQPGVGLLQSPLLFWREADTARLISGRVQIKRHGIDSSGMQKLENTSFVLYKLYKHRRIHSDEVCNAVPGRLENIALNKTKYLFHAGLYLGASRNCDLGVVHRSLTVGILTSCPELRTVHLYGVSTLFDDNFFCPLLSSQSLSRLENLHVKQDVGLQFGVTGHRPDYHHYRPSWVLDPFNISFSIVRTWEKSMSRIGISPKKILTRYLRNLIMIIFL